MSLERDLLRLKETVKEAGQRLSEAQGALKQLLSDLKKTYGVADLKEAKKKVNELEKEEAKLEDELASGIAKLKLKMEGEDEDE